MDLNMSYNYTIPQVQTGCAPSIDHLSIDQFCKASDGQAVQVAIAGFILGMLMVIYFGKLRVWMMEHQKIPGWVVAFLDKFFVVLNAMAYAIILTRLLHAGL